MAAAPGCPSDFRTLEMTPAQRVRKRSRRAGIVLLVPCLLFGALGLALYQLRPAIAGGCRTSRRFASDSHLCTCAGPSGLCRPVAPRLDHHRLHEGRVMHTLVVAVGLSKLYWFEQARAPGLSRSRMGRGARVAKGDGL